MEHLPAPQTPTLTVRVPYLGRIYNDDGLNYATYPERHNWNPGTTFNDISSYDLSDHLKSTSALDALDFLLDLQNNSHDTSETVRITLQASIDRIWFFMFRSYPDSMKELFQGVPDKAKIKGLREWVARTESLSMQHLIKLSDKEGAHGVSSSPQPWGPYGDAKLLRAITVFTSNRYITKPKDFFARRSRSLELFDDTIKFGWEPWILADPFDSRLQSVKVGYTRFQEWFFFGMLQQSFATLGIYVNQQDFIHASGRYLNTEAITNYVRMMVIHHATDIEGNWNTRFQACLRIHGVRVNRFTDFWESHQHKSLGADDQESFFASHVMYSLDSLSRYLANYVADLSRTSFGDRRPGSLVTNLLIATGWCKHQIAEITANGTDKLAYYACMMGPTENFDHSQCTVEHCRQNTLLASAYHLKHQTRNSDTLRPCIDCLTHHTLLMGPNVSPYFQQWGPSQDRIYQILSRDQILIIVVRRGQPLDVTYYQPGMSYVAISHVWSNGRGNPSSNTLPICQVMFLAHKTMEVLGRNNTVAFWIDTLCVPLQPKEARKKAIIGMRNVYKQADATLVLDSGLEEIDTMAHPVEQALRLYNSDWTRRLWTFQEGVLANNLFVQFGKGRPVKLDHLLRRASRSLVTHDKGILIKTRPLSMLCQEVFGHLANMYRFRGMDDVDARYTSLGRNISTLSQINEGEGGDGGDGQKLELANVWPAVSWRNTTRKEDEAVCIATIVQADLGKILAEDDSQRRLRCLYEDLEHVPLGLLFADCPRMSKANFKWAPTSLMHCTDTATTTHALQYPDSVGTVTPNGLEFQATGLLLDTITANHIMYRDRFNIFPYWISQTASNQAGDDNFYDCWEFEGYYEQLIHQLRTPECRIALVIPGGVVDVATMRRTSAAFVRVKREEGDTIFAEYVCPGSTGLIGRDLFWYNSEIHRQKFRETFIPATKLPRDQKWCIS
ncbi:hypothetical protein BDV96DRAFT_629159 [Lophiotrema nucula]|uniref:Heterokaryon incompatibility domain-containing protein n=1 Tax=Lophiotrema nucula TaxID=690887 RepID=A0A6A5ZLA1_9PLEO|nr:hypothetical protein BDV96DRAFT_629159 [Lophiotrema nucula]